MGEEFSLIRWKLIIAVTVGLIFAVFAAFLVLAILVCRQKILMSKRKKEVLAERLNRRQWLIEQNSNLINHLFNQFQPVNSSIPLPSIHPSAFIHSIPDTENGNSQNISSLASSYSYRPTSEPGPDNSRFHYSHSPSTLGEASLASKIDFQYRTNIKSNQIQSKKRCYMGWVDNSSQFDSFGSATPNLHRIPEKIVKESSDRGTLFEGDSGYSNMVPHMELLDVNHNVSLAWNE